MTTSVECELWHGREGVVEASVRTSKLRATRAGQRGLGHVGAARDYGGSHLFCRAFCMRREGRCEAEDAEMLLVLRRIPVYSWHYGQGRYHFYQSPGSSRSIRRDSRN